MVREVYSRLPAVAQRPARAVYYRLTGEEKTTPEPDFVERFFPGKSEFEAYADEFEDEARTIYNQHIRPLHEAYGDGTIGSGEVPLDVALRYYALVRVTKPTVVVETGVANGFSTAAILAALDANDHGHLYSVDYPFYRDEDSDAYRDELDYDTDCVDAIPADKEPGWVIPDQYRDRWTLRIGLSQQELPELVTRSVDEIDLFIHDSEHSFPCMLFEFELALNHLADDGIMLADDVDMTGAFDRFADERDGEVGRLHRRVGYFLPE